MEMQPLTDEQKRAIANQRLGPQGLQSFNAFIQKMRAGQHSNEEAQGQVAQKEQEDIFGNPMMLSMLLCYLSPKAGDDTRKRRLTDEETPVDLMAVYRVSVSVMLKRMLLQQQADRHIPEEALVQCSRVLERAAMNMQAKHVTELECEAFEKELSTDLKASWTSLRLAVETGRAMLLRMHREGNRTFIRFMIKGFQDYFSACAISNSNDFDDLPGYKQLLTEPWWAQMLDMLAQAWPKKYVQMMEKKIEKFDAEQKYSDGSSFLHVAAVEGHLPIFKLVRSFSDANQTYLWKARISDQKTPLHVASQNGHLLVCKTILEKKASVNVEDSKERLPLHLALQHGHFQLARYLLDRLEEVQAAGKDESRPKKKNIIESLACRILGQPVEGENSEPMDEEDFKMEVPEVFLEMKYFRKVEENERVRQMAALLSVYWVIADQYYNFSREQPAGDKLKPESWEHMLQWVKEVGLTPKRVAAVLVYCAIVGIGKISPFHQHFAPDATEPIGALASIVTRHQVLVPSFQRLDEEEQNLIIYCLKAQANFNFGQFLQGESLPVSLAKCKELLICPQETILHDVFSFFLLTVFMSLCAILGVKSLNGSLFMTEDMYDNFKVGLEALKTLKDKEALTVYDGFLQKRAELAGVQFDEKCPTQEQKAIVRLICLTRVFEKSKGKRVHDEFMCLDPDVRQELTEFLNADGLNQRGFLLFHSPALMTNAEQNKSLSPAEAMRQLLKMYQLSEEAFPPEGDDAGVITVMVEEMANHAKKCQDPEVFKSTNLEVKRFQGANADRTAKIVLSPWQIVTDQNFLDDVCEEVNELFLEVAMSSCTEQAFQSRLKTAFPEFKYLEGEGEEVAEIRKRAHCTMLCIYWLASDRYEEFTRGQEVSKRLTDDSWAFLRGWLGPLFEEVDVMSVVCAAVMVRTICAVPKFRQQQAKGLTESRDVMAHVLKHCPKVLPSYQRLDEEDRMQLAECLGHDFELKLFLDAESCPAGLAVLSKLVQGETPEVATRRSLDSLSILMWSSFLELAGSMGAESQEGSLYMTEERCKKIQVATESIRQMGEKKSEVQVYDLILEKRAEAVHLSFNQSDGASKAVARLSCLASSRDATDAGNVEKALKALAPEEYNRMVKYLTNGSGEHVPEAAEVTAGEERPVYAVLQAASFLEKARDNPEIGLTQATRTLLRVYDAAELEFQDVRAPMVRIRLGKLAHFAAHFVGSAKFQDVPFELKRTYDLEVDVVPKVWIPVTNQQVLQKLNSEAIDLCTELRDHKLSERSFRERISHVYPELAYFGPGATALREQSICALCCVFWLQTNNHEAFIQGQPTDSQLSKQSWAWIQDWLAKSVKLAPELLDAALTFMAIHALGKYKAFRADFESVKNCTPEMHDMVLAQILEERPEVVPSVNRLDEKYRSLIIDCLRVDFEFSQFLLGENTAANLVMVKERLKAHGPQGHSFFLFRIFAQMCGKLGPKSQFGSLFMNEARFKRCTPGLKALQQLWTRDGKACYDEFMLLRGSKAMSRFASPEHQALSRLLCLFDAYDKDEGSSLCNAFDELSSQERACLTQWLNCDSETCGVIIPNAAQMLQSAKNNCEVGLANALRMMLKVRQECLAHEKDRVARLVVQFNGLVTWVKDYRGDMPGDCLQVALQSTAETQGDTKVVCLTVDPSVLTVATSGSLGPLNEADREPEAEVDAVDAESHPSPHGPSPRQSPRTPTTSAASPARHLHDTETQTQQSESPQPPGRRRPSPPRRFCLGRYSIAGLALAWFVLALCLGDVQFTFSWRQLLVSLLVLALVMLGLYVQCNNIEIPVESGMPELHRGPAEPFLAQLGAAREERAI
ncbi:unnamed protein product [Effrenium voratum]|nr:unnamed protein product [Effrenium voratum]